MTPDIIASDSEWPYSKAKTAVLLAAASVIREEGPRAATLKNIAGRAGITGPAIFRHFDGVDGLFSGLFSAFERIADQCDRAYDTEETGLARLRDVMNGLVDVLASSGDLAYIVLNAGLIFRGYPDLLGRVMELKRADERKALDCIAKGVSCGEIRSDLDPDTILATSLGLLRFTAEAWIESAFGFDLREAFEDRWDDAERFISAKPIARSAKRASRLRSAALKVESPASEREGARSTKPAKARATNKKVPAKAKPKAVRLQAKAPTSKAKKKEGRVRRLPAEAPGPARILRKGPSLRHG